MPASALQTWTLKPEPSGWACKSKTSGPRVQTPPKVEFVARFRIAGRAVRLHERSRFVCEGGRWFYVERRSVSRIFNL